MTRARRFARVAVAMAMVGAPSSPALADEPAASPDRPDASNSTDTIAPGYAQLEVGAVVSRLRARETTFSTPFVLRAGLSKAIELRLGGDGLLGRSIKGVESFDVGNMSLGFKARMLEEGDVCPSIGLEPVIIVPVARRSTGLGTGRPTFVGTLLISKDLPAGFHADANVAVNVVGVEGESGFRPRGLASLSMSRPFFDGRLVPFWEAYGLTEDLPGDGASASTDFGAIFRVHRRFTFDVAVDVGLTPTPSITGTVGVAVLFGRMR